MSRDTERDLSALLRDLETTLADLQEAVDREERDGREDERERRDDRPTPPRPAEVIRFTEEYTIPTMISVLETTIRSLELLRGVLRLAGSDRSLGERDRAPERRLLEESLGDLRRVLTATEDPPNSAARDVLDEARALTAEIESRLEEARDDRTGRRRDERRRGDRRRRTRGRETEGGVRIPVDDGGADEENSNTEHEVDAEEESTVDVDVEAELQSIRDEVHGTTDREEPGDGGDEQTAEGERTAGAASSDDGGSAEEVDGEDESAQAGR